MPISRGPAGGHKSQERGFLLSSVARLETGSRQGAEAGVLFWPTPESGAGSPTRLPSACPFPLALPGLAQLKFALRQVPPSSQAPAPEGAFLTCQLAAV